MCLCIGRCLHRGTGEELRGAVEAWVAVAVTGGVAAAVEASVVETRAAVVATVAVAGAEAAGVVAMGVVMGVGGVFLVVMAEAMGVGVVIGVEQPYVLLTRSHCNRCPECRLSTPNQGRRPHRRRC